MPISHGEMHSGGGGGGSLMVCGGSGGNGGSYADAVVIHNSRAAMHDHMYGRGSVQVVAVGPARPKRQKEEAFECDYSLSQRTANYCKWGMRA